MQKNKVVVTGMGIVSSLGCDLETVSNSLQKGESGIVYDSFRKSKGFRSALTGELKGFDITRWGFSKKQLKTMGEPAVYACASALDAIKDSGLEVSLNPERIGIVVGNDSCVKASYDSVRIINDEVKETRLIGSGAIFQTMTSTASMNLGVLLGVKGLNITLSAACASGAHSIGYSLALLRAGLLDAVICGGAQELNWEVYAPFDGIGAFSVNEEEPSKASRPFDRKRDGLVPSGGGAIIILETEAHAEKRKCKKIYGEIAGYGFSSDGMHLSIPTGEGGKRAMRMALKDADVLPEDVDYVNAHATSTPEGDKAEALVINSVLGENVFVSSTKSLTGHECWMAGASEAIYSLLMIKDKFIAGNLNFEEQEETAAKINILKESKSHDLRVIVSDSFGFGGTNAVLVIKQSENKSKTS
ncbi:MAG: hypothetical protein ACD_79C00729G0001 [uncultured bacterium]|nr:MAG: hypothetical protein ACD_79C00729G0001 [uncultured bacterium]